MTYFLVILQFLLSIVFCGSSPLPIDASVAASVSAGKPPVSFEHGNVGVNFGGYSASAGLGGLLTGDAAAGGLHAEYGTPFGHSGGAGLGGVTGGKSSGGAYAGAVVTGGAVGAGAAGGYGIHKEEVLSEKHYTSPPRVVHEETIQERPTVSRTVIEKTVIPQYVEKTIQVPTYVEKTVRVPSFVEHKVRVPVTPKVIEKTFDEKVDVTTNVRSRGHVQKVGGAFGGFNIGAAAMAGTGGGGGFVHHPPPPPPPVHGGFAAGGSLTKSGQFFSDVFAIPINTLGAVSNLLGGIGGGGSVSLSKSYSHL